MSEENSNQPVDIDDDNQEAFEQEFFGKTSPSQESVADEPKEEPVEEPQEVDDLGEDDDPPAPEETDEDDEPVEEEKPQGKKKNSAQERINELTAKARHEERERIRERTEFERRIAELEAVVKREAEQTQKPLKQQLPDGAPKPDAVGEDGEPIYPLGDFDPQYIADLTNYTVEQRLAAAEEKRAQEAQARAIQQAQEEIREDWINKVNEAEKELPDLREHIVELTDTFQDLPPQYGEYLATTIMSSEFGPQIMYYLSQNIGEAQKIVASGPAAATLALGRLEAKFIGSTNKEEKRNKKVTEAQEPPTERTRGTHGQFSVAPDTDNQAAFEREFFKKK